MEVRRWKDEQEGEYGRMNGREKTEGYMEGRRSKDGWKGEDEKTNEEFEKELIIFIIFIAVVVVIIYYNYYYLL